MKLLRILTVDDEVLALRRLKLLLQTMPQVDHVGEAGSCAEALGKIDALHPDALLLDIRMRDGNGFDLVEAIAQRPQPPLIVFVTAFDQFATQAFESGVADYLLKPVERDRLVRAIVRLQQQVQASETQGRIDELQQVLRNLRAAHAGAGGPAFDSEFWVRGPGGLVRVPVDSIDCVSSEDEYIEIHTASGSHLMRGSIRQFVDRVEPGLFIRVHRRWLVRRSAIVQLTTRRVGTAEVVLRNGRRLPTGRVHLKQLRQSLSPSHL